MIWALRNPTSSVFQQRFSGWVVELLLPGSWEMKPLSRVSKRLREVCLPFLFRRVEFWFSEAGFHELENLITSDICHHVVSLAYIVPELLKTNILDFDCFKSNIFTPEDYMEEAKDLYDTGYPADKCAPYIVIYNALRRVCEEQRNIVDSSLDPTLLSSALAALPRLKELSLCFCETVERTQEWLEPYLALDMNIIPESPQMPSRTPEIMLPYHGPWEIPNLGTLSESLAGLLGQVQTLHLTRCGHLLELLSHCTLNLHRLDMCHVILEANSKSIRSIRFHDVQLIGEDRLETLSHGLSPELLCSMLDMAPMSVLSRAVGCQCLPFWEKGWSLLLGDDRSRCRVGGSSKRKLSDV
ncbi:hypothetical protein AJ80_09305 [Polytolypa hystricis UAMH7299]|uniref:Uncharacterized protein n=1 Tax=Polytolypa hystricis (strain UAMH7299) TaxID=1447883 RepID=A0A2B7WT82_POLH7|nr:hypothetical protein AJ80_09305 [Polytolypa hystricis UAMH7299]